MNENQSVLCFHQGELLWYAGAGASPLAMQHADVRERFDLEVQQPEHRVVFAAPGDSIRLLEVQVQPEERKHLAVALPFILEDSLSEDIEALHFARSELSPDRYGVAIVAREQMAHWREVLGESALRLPWLPEPLLLPWGEGEWTLLIEEQSVLLRYGQCEGARIEKALLDPLLMSLEQEETPERIVVYGNREANDRALLPETLAALVEWRRGGLEAALLLSDARPAGPNLLQGDYAPQLPYAKWWGQWRSVAAILTIALTLHLLSGWLDHRRLERENLALRAEVQAVYRGVNPRGAISDAEAQLSRQLADLRGGDSGQTFSALLAPVATMMQSREGMVLASLSYNQRNGQLRVNLLAPSFAEVEALRSALVAAGFVTTLENSSRSNNQVRARLRVEASA